MKPKKIVKRFTLKHGKATCLVRNFPF